MARLTRGNSNMAAWQSSDWTTAQSNATNEGRRQTQSILHETIETYVIKILVSLIRSYVSSIVTTSGKPTTRRDFFISIN
jgi:hypothetical protein